MQRIALFLILALAAAAAQAQTKSDAPKAKAEAPKAQAKDAPSQALDLPKRKSGLWELKRSPTDAHPLQMCVEEKSDNAFRFLAEGRHKEACKVDKSVRDGDKWTVDATCTLANHKITAKTHAVVTGKFDSAYKIESTSTFEQPVNEKTGTSAVIEQRWTGPCKPDQHPGDVILADGRKVNLVAEAKAEGRKQRVEERSQGRKKKTTTETTQ